MTIGPNNIGHSTKLISLSGETRMPERTAILDYWRAEDVPEPLRNDAFLRGAIYEVAVVAKREVDELKHAHSKRIDAIYKENTELKDAVYQMFLAMKTPDQYVITPNHVPNMEEWCGENCTDTYEVLLNHHQLGCLVLFKNSRDATLFKLFCGY